MEIRIRRRLTGRELRDRILERYEDRGTVEGKAEAGDAEAQDALFNLQRFDEDPTRLDDVVAIEDVVILDRNDLSKLTETRLHILEVLREFGQTNVKEPTARLQ